MIHCVARIQYPTLLLLYTILLVYEPLWGPNTVPHFVIVIYNTISVWTIVWPQYSTWTFSCTILAHYSTALIISKNFHILSSFNVKEIGSHWVLFLLYLNIVLNWPEDGRLWPKHVAKYNLIVIIASCHDVRCVLTVRNTLYKYDNTQRDGISKQKLASRTERRI